MGDDTTTVRRISNGFIISKTSFLRDGRAKQDERFSPTDPLKGAAKPKAPAKPRARGRK